MARGPVDSVPRAAGLVPQAHDGPDFAFTSFGFPRLLKIPVVTADVAQFAAESIRLIRFSACSMCAARAVLLGCLFSCWSAQPE